MEVHHRNRAHPVRASNHDVGIERGQRHRHVRGVGRDAAVAGAEYGVHAVDPFQRVAACPRVSLVAGGGEVHKIGTAGALHQVAADARRVSQLRRRAGQHRTRQHREAASDRRVVSEVAVAHERADFDRAVRVLGNAVEARQPVQVHEPRGPLDALQHEVH